MSSENSGLRVNYYLCEVAHPQREEQPPYQAECEDIIDALGLTFDEANIFKEIWRTANERTHGKGKEGNNPLRAAQKLVHYSGRILRKAQQAALDLIQSGMVTSDKIAPDIYVEWTIWRGGECPVAKNTWVAVRLRDGTVYDKISSNSLTWVHDGKGGDIVQYRVLTV